MNNKIKIICVITARGGSKGLPGKNIKLLDGKPLISWTIAAALGSRHIDRVVVSTDDPEIGRIAEQAGAQVPFVRPPELATDEARSIDVVLHALDAIDEAYDYVVLLQPTSPFRTADDIDACIERCTEGAPACVSVVALDKSPAWMYQVDNTNHLMPVLSEESKASRRQDVAEAVALNGAVYAADITVLRKTRSFLTDETVAYVMPAERSLDIDTPFQFAFAEFLSQRTTGPEKEN